MLRVDIILIIYLYVYKKYSAITLWPLYPNIFANDEVKVGMKHGSHAPMGVGVLHIYTVYPKKYAHGFVVLCFVVVM